MLGLALFVYMFAVFAQAQPTPDDGPEAALSASTMGALLAEVDHLTAASESAPQYDQILAMLERALATAPDDYQLLWRAARACHRRGDYAEEHEKAIYFTRGITLGQQAVTQQPRGVEGHFWLGANYGSMSELQGMFKALQMLQKIRLEMKTVLQLQASYANGDAYRALGEIDRQLPAMLGGSLKRAVTYLEQGLQVAPQNLAMKLALSKAYREVGRKQESQQLLNEILQTPVPPEPARADSEIRQKARQLLYE